MSQDYRFKIARNAALVVAAISFFVVGQTGDCKWTPIEEAPYIIEFENVDFTIEKNGDVEMILESKIKIVKDSAKIEKGMLKYEYEPSTQKIKLLEAYTITNGHRYSVESKFIEDKQVGNTDVGLKGGRMLTVVFPMVEVGSETYYKFKLKTKNTKQSLAYDRFFRFGFDAPELPATVNFTSHKKLYYEVNDPENALTVIDKTDDAGVQHLTIRLNKTVFRVVKNEVQPLMNWKRDFTWVALSTAKDWKESSSDLIKAYNGILSERVPEEFVPVIEAAKAKTTDIEKANTVLEAIHSKFRYTGDWRRGENAQIPRSIKEISKTKFGDCKDLSSLAVMLMRRVGLDAHPVFINVSSPTVSPNELTATGLPIAMFNHAIVYVGSKPKPLWIDATDPAIAADAMPANLSNRPALVLFPFGAEMKITPQISPAENSRGIVIQSLVEKNGDTDAAGHFTATKVSIRGIRRSLYDLKTNESATESFISHMASGTPTSWETMPFDFISRVVEPLSIEYRYKARDGVTKVDENKFKISTSTWIAPVSKINLDNQRVSGYMRGAPENATFVEIYLNGKLSANRKFDCTIRNKWVDYTRRVLQTKYGATLMAQTSWKTDRIESEEINSPEFQKFTAQVEKCSSQGDAVVTILDKGKMRSPATLAPPAFFDSMAISLEATRQLGKLGLNP